MPGLIFGLDLKVNYNKKKDIFVGKDAIKKRGILSLYHPI